MPSSLPRTNPFGHSVLLLYGAVDHQTRRLMQPELTDERYTLYARFLRGIIKLATRHLEAHNESLAYPPATLLRIKAALKTAEQVYQRLQDANLFTAYADFEVASLEAALLDGFFREFY